VRRKRRGSTAAAAAGAAAVQHDAMAAMAWDGTPAKNAAVASSRGDVRAAAEDAPDDADRRSRVGGWAGGAWAMTR